MVLGVKCRAETGAAGRVFSEQSGCKVVGSSEENGGGELEKKALSGADQDHG